MSNKNCLSDLVRAVADGKSFKQAVRDASLSDQAAFLNLEEPAEVTKAYERRARLTELALDRLTLALDPACAQLVKLAYEAKSENVRLAALRTLVNCQDKLRDKHELDVRVRQVETQLRAAAGADEQAGSVSTDYWPPSLDAGTPRVVGMSRADSIRLNAIWLTFQMKNDPNLSQEQKKELKRQSDALRATSMSLDQSALKYGPDSNAANDDRPESPEADSRRTDFQSVQNQHEAPASESIVRRGSPDQIVRRGSPDPAETDDQRSPSVAPPSALGPDPITPHDFRAKPCQNVPNGDDSRRTDFPSVRNLKAEIPKMDH